MAPTRIVHNGGPMLVFEPEETYLLENNKVGYWGPVTSSIDWCERNYVFLCMPHRARTPA